ncbi:flagellar filament capping protein FliD [Egicoccus sp. AB-alg2]|uniref:flagellar filament capping protein FliD n=1 Tax=Egicoccus sp. AB-alg2 TaxID=3242693 RepID=UPI00359CECDF
MSTPFASIGGIASGLDTATIVQQLMQLERQSMVPLQTRQQTYRAADAAWGSIVTRLSSLRSATDALRDPQVLAGTVKVSSSNQAVASASVKGAGALPGTAVLNVTQLAAAHQVALGGTFTGNDQVLGAGSITVSRGDTQHTVTLGEGATLADAARALNGVEGLQARVVRVGEGEHRLVVSSRTTGAGSAFTVTSDVAAFNGGGTTNLEVLQAGRDAVLSMDGLTVTRSSNTVDDLLEGITLSLSDVGTTTVRIEQDLEGATKKVKALVDAMNGLLNELNRQGATSSEAGARGPLSGDPLVRSLTTQIRGSLSQIVTEDGPFRTLNDLGISLTRQGSITLDESKLTAALTSDPQAVGKLLGRAGSTSDARLSLTTSGRAPAGDYQLQIDTAPRIAVATGAAFSPPGSIQPKTFTITAADGTSVSVVIDETVDVQASVLKINAALAGTKLSWLRAETVEHEDGTVAVSLKADRAGTSRNFTVDGSEELDLDGTAAGANVAGTLTNPATGESWQLSGTGQTLTGPTGSAIAGLVLRAPLDATGDLGSVRIDNGLAGVLDGILRAAEGSGGSIAGAREALQSRIKATTDSLEAFERRLELRETTIRRQFTALESAMARMNSQAMWMAQQLTGMTQ